MFYANGIEIPRLTPFEAYKIIGGAGILADTFIFIVIFLLLTILLICLGVSPRYYATKTTARTDEQSDRLMKRKIVLPLALTAVLSLVVVVFFFSLSSYLARPVMLLEHYNAQLPNGEHLEIPTRDKHSTIESVLVTQEDGTVVSYDKLYAIMDKDGLVSLNVNEGTEDALSLVPLDQVE